MVNEVETFLLAAANEPFSTEGFEKYCAKRGLNLSCPVIHVAGVTGKACTLAYLEGIYLAAGYHVATLYNDSLDEVNESIRFDGKDIADDEVAGLWKDNHKDFEKFDLSRFEARVALAYRYFEKKKPDIALIEVGLGGTYDPTNLESLDTRLSIITSISLDHTAELGTTLSQIALHAAGIIKPASMVLTGNIEETSMDTIREQARVAKAKPVKVEAFHNQHLVDAQFHFDYGPYKDAVINTEASYQVINASLALEAVRLLAEDFPVDDEAVRKGLLASNLPGRFERFGRITLDVAHNPESMTALSRCVRTIGKGRPVHVLFASEREKNIAVELPTLANVVDSITLTTYDDENARSEFDFMIYAADHPYVEDAVSALKGLLEAYPEDAILVTGAVKFVMTIRNELLRGDLR